MHSPTTAPAPEDTACSGGDVPISARKVAAFAGILLALLLLVYGASLDNGFVLDDDALVTDYDNITEPGGLYRIWLTTEQLDYWPLTYSSLWLEWRAFGMNPVGYHVVSLLLHLVSCLLVWLILLRLRIPGAALAAILFAVHPVNVESVAWVVQRKNTLAMVFFLLTVLAWVYRGPDGSRRTWWTAMGLFVLALLAKTSVVMLPFVLIGCTWWQRGRLTVRDAVRTLPFFALSLGFGLLTMWFQYHRVIGWNLVRSDGPLSRLMGASWASWFYLGKAVLPVDLKVVYPRWDLDPAWGPGWLPLLALLLGVGVLLYKHRSWGRAPLFAALFYLLNLVPILGLVNVHFMKLSLVADHWQYTSLIGVVALAAAGGTTWALAGDRRRRLVGMAVAAGLVAAMMVQSYRHARNFDGLETFARSAVAGNPDCPASWFMLGAALEGTDRAAEASGCFARGTQASARRLALRGHLEPHLHSDHGFILLSAGRADEAESFLRAGIEREPDDAKARLHLGSILESRGQVDAAIDQYRKGVSNRPLVARARFKLGLSLALQGRTAEAIEAYREGLALSPDNARGHAAIGTLLSSTGQIGEAVKHLEQALSLDPTLPDALRQRLHQLRGQYRPRPAPP